MKFYIIGLLFCIPTLACEPALVKESPLFPGVSEAQASDFLAREKVQPVRVAQGQDVGFNMPKLSVSHRDVLRASKDKVILEFGPGHGYFMAKALLAGAQEVMGIEKSQQAAALISTEIERYEQFFSKNFANRFTVLNADAVNAILKLKENGKKFDLIVGFNFLHYLCPSDAKKVLWRIKPLLKENGEVLFTMNTPSGVKHMVKTYLEAKQDKNNFFPGWMMVSRQDSINVIFDSNGRVVKQLDKEKTEFVSSKPLSADVTTSPSALFSRNMTAYPSTSQVIIDIDQTSLLWDMDTARTVFNSFKYDIIEMYYINNNDQKLDNLDFELAEKEIFNLVVRARPKKS